MKGLVHSGPLVARFVISVLHKPGLTMAPWSPCSPLHPPQLLPSQALLGMLFC